MKPRKLPPQPIRDMFAPTPTAFVDLRNRPRRGGGGRKWNRNRQRFAEINHLIDHRHGGQCDTDDGYAYLTAALPALIEEAGGLASTTCDASVRSWAAISLPLMTSGEVDTCLAEARERNARRKLHLGAQQVGDLVRLSTAERETLNIRMIRPADMTDPKFKAYTRARDADRKRAVRAAAGAKPHALSEARQQPWIALGMKRRTYYRRLAAGTLPTRGTNSSGLDTKYLQHRTQRCQGGQETVLGPARNGRDSRGVGAGGHTPGGKARAVRRGRAVAMPLPSGEAWTQGDMLGDWYPLGSVVAKTTISLRGYEGGPMRPDQRQAARDWLRQMGWTRKQFGSLIGISQQQVTNSLRARGSDGFSQSVASNLRRLLEVAA